MNKKANRRAFFVCLLVTVMYASVAARLPEKFNVARVSGEKRPMSKTLGASIPKPATKLPVSEVHASAPKDELSEKDSTDMPMPATEVPGSPTDAPVSGKNGDSMEPGLLIAIPIVSHAIKTGLIEETGLIFVQKEGYNTINCNKPIDILKDRDEQGLRVIARIIGNRQSLDFLKKEGILTKANMDSESIILGAGYMINQEKLLSLYDKHVSRDFDKLFPFVANGVAVTKTSKGFALVPAKERPQVPNVKEESEWMMPNVMNLPMKAAIEKITVHTSNIKVHGSGVVTDQQPPPFERTRGETECVLYGRSLR